LQAFATLIPGGLRLDEALFPISHRDPLMEQSPLTPAPDGAEVPAGGTGDTPLDTPMAHWPVTLVCEVGRLELSLQALGELAPGSVLALPGSLGRLVRLRANGQPFGQGELVWLGDSLGVRLTGLASDE
jgi:type III secretion protein Q